jgi:ABC-type transport system substrate-binding protein
MNFRRLAAVLTAAALTTTACGGSQETAPPPTSLEGGQVVFAVNDLPTSWNPASTAWAGPATTIARTFLDPLVVVDQNGGWQPYLAESLTPNADATQWDITLRDGITFHDGTPLNAEALVANLNNALGGIVLGPPLKSVTDITIANPLTVRITLNERHANFPLLFTSQGGYILAPATLTAYANGETGVRPIGTGPWQFSIDDSDGVIVTKNRNYWRFDADGNRLPYLDKIEFRLEPDVLTRRILLESGDIDALLDNTPAQVRQWADGTLSPGFTVIVDDNFSDRTYGALNTQTGPFFDVRLRRAAALATDRQAVVDLVGGGYPATDGPYTPDSPWYASSGWPDPNPDEAKRLVAQWTAENNGVPPQVDLVVSQGINQLKLAQTLETQWENVGFNVNVRSFPTEQFIVELVTGQFDALVVQQFSSVDPVGDESFWRAQTINPEGQLSLNFPRFSNGVIEEGLRQARATTDYETRKAGYTAVWREWAKEFPYLFLFSSPQAAVSSPRIQNVGILTTPDGQQAAEFSWGGTWLTQTSETK